MEVILTSGPASDVSEIATRAPDEATTEELVFNSTKLVDLSKVSTSWRLVDERIARCSPPLESMEIAISIISSSEFSAKIG